MMRPRDKYSKFVKEIVSNPSDDGVPTPDGIMERDRWVHPLSANPYEPRNIDESLHRSSKLASATAVRQHDHSSYIKKVESHWKNPHGGMQDQERHIISVNRTVNVQKDRPDQIKKKKVIAVVNMCF